MKGLAVLVVLSCVILVLVHAHEDNEEDSSQLEVNPRFARASNKHKATEEAEKTKKKKSGKAKKAKKGKKAKSLLEESPGQERQASNTGSNCNYVDLGSLSTKGSGCSSDGSKFVLKTASGVRKQFLVLNGKTIIGFTNGKFSDCASSGFTDITSKVTCKVVAGLPGVILSSSGTGSTVSSATAATTTTKATTLASNTSLRLPIFDSRCNGLTVPVNGSDCTGKDFLFCLFDGKCAPGSFGKVCSYTVSLCIPALFLLAPNPKWSNSVITCQSTSSAASSCNCVTTSGTAQQNTDAPGSTGVCGLDNNTYASTCLAITQGQVFSCGNIACPCPSFNTTSKIIDMYRPNIYQMMEQAGSSNSLTFN